MTVQILTGDCRALLRALPDESVHCVVTSPPYYRLRDYGEPAQIGWEDTVPAYIETLVEVFREVRRVLRRDGVVWLNIDDSRVHGSGVSKRRDTRNGDVAWRGGAIRNHPKSASPIGAARGAGLKPKDLMLIPQRLSIALQADGWWVRSRTVWSKPNPLPTSASDRPTDSCEEVYLLAKAERYYYDRFAILEDVPAGAVLRLKQDIAQQLASARGKAAGSLQGANRRNVWSIASEAYGGQHFATFPRHLAELCILAGTSAAGCCPGCGKPWQRVVTKGPPDRAWQSACGGDAERAYRGRSTKDHEAAGVQDASAVKSRILAGMRVRQTAGWRQACRCRPASAVPCTVLDPFGGSGTTGLVADRLGRDAILIDLSPKYTAEARRRIAADAPLLGAVDPPETASLADLFPTPEAAE